MITIPKLDTVNAIGFIKQLHETEISSDMEVDFDFSPNWVEPYGLLLCGSALKSFRKQNESITMRIFVSDTNVTDYSGHIGFFKYISESILIGKLPGEASGGINYVPITVLDFEQLHSQAIEAGNYGDMNDTIEAEAKRLSSVLCHSDYNLSKLCTYIIREILRNTPEHAESKTATMCAQYWKGGKAEIAILDEGIGIKNSLRKNVVHQKYILNDLDALESAVKPGISQAFSPEQKNKSDDTWSNSGFGLFMASEICKRLNGEFWITSGEKALKISSSGTTVYDTFFNGTAIRITVNTSGLRDSQKLITEIAKYGESISKDIRNAFKNASEPSKSLLISQE